MSEAGVSLTQLQQAYDRAVAYVESVVSADVMTGHTSEFWTKALTERPSYPAFEEMLTMRRGATYPMAERRNVADHVAEREFANAAYEVATRSIPAESGFLQTLDEPAFGCPPSFEFFSNQLTANCLVNAVTVYSLLQALERAGVSRRPLRVLEIGAGFGQAARMICERLDVRSYAVCDLPENLFLSAFYLQGVFPDRPVTFIDESAPHDGDGLFFVVPPFAKILKGPLDVIFNSYSFQEMNSASVDGYFALAARTLAPDGVFYSLNSHGKDEIVWPSEYPVSTFRIDRISSPRKFPFQVNATIPYELVLRSPPAGPSRAGELATRALDGIACAFQLGLDDELGGLCDRLVLDTLAPGEEEWLLNLTGLFRAPSLDEKHVHVDELRASGVLPEVTAYLSGCLACAAGDSVDASHSLRDALPGLGRSLARVHTLAMLEPPEIAGQAAGELAPHLASQVEAMARSQGAYAEYMQACLRFGPVTVAEPSRLRRSVRRIGRSIPTQSR